MKTILTTLFLLMTLLSNAQQDNYKASWLEKWQNSRDYLVAIAEAMPEEHYTFKPTEREMSFSAQLEHIQGNMNWLGKEYFNMPQAAKLDDKSMSKSEVIARIKTSFNSVYEAVKNTPEKDFKQEVSFFAGPKTKYQILGLLQDHVTHHRGQVIVYLNLNDVKPPAFVGW